MVSLSLDIPEVGEEGWGEPLRTALLALQGALNGLGTGDVAGLTALLSGYSTTAHTHAASGVVSGTFDAARIPQLEQSKIIDLVTTLALKAAIADVVLQTEKGANSGVATLDSSGKIPIGQLPSLAVIDFLGTSSNQAAMLAKTGQKGDWTIRLDDNKTYIITGNDPTQVGSWTSIAYPTGGGGGGGTWGSIIGTLADQADLQAALNAKAPTANPTFTGTVSGVTKAHVGLGNVDNTADSAKPVSAAQQAALDLKASLASPSLTGNPTAPTQASSDSSTRLSTTAFVQAAITALIASAPANLNDLNKLAAAVNDDPNYWQTVNTALAGKAPLASPALTGAPTAPTVAGTSDATTKIATTAFVQNVVAALGGGGGTGNVISAAGLVGNGVTDDGPAIQAWIDAGNRHLFLDGSKTYYVNTPIFLDNTSAYYKFFLHTNGATVVLGPNLPTSVKFTRDTTARILFFNNILRSTYNSGTASVTWSTDDGARATGAGVGGLNRFYILGGNFKSTTGTTLLAFGNRTAVHFSNVCGVGISGLYSWVDYADCSVFDHCQMRKETLTTEQAQAAYMVHQFTQGDGLVITSPKVDSPMGLVNASNSAGMHITADVTARMVFTRCKAVKIDALHMEGRDDALAAIKSFNSQITVDGSILYMRSGTQAFVEIDDAPLGSDVQGSDITFDNCQTAAWIYGDIQNGPLVKVISAIRNTVVRARNMRHLNVASGDTQWSNGVFPGLDVTAVSVMVSAVSEGQAILGGGTWELRRVSGNNWKIIGPAGPANSEQKALANPAIGSPAAMGAGTTAGSLANGTTYQYMIALINSANQFTAASAASSVTANAQQVNRIRADLADVPAAIMVWRKAGGSPAAGADVYAILPAGDSYVKLFDTGNFINGVPWISTSVPVPNTVAATNQTTTWQSSYALLDSPAFVGLPTAPNPLTLAIDNTQIATTAWVRDLIQDLVPGIINTTIPAVTAPIKWDSVSSTWKYNGVTVTAVPAALRSADNILFVGNPGGSLPGWAPTNSVWTQG